MPKKQLIRFERSVIFNKLQNEEEVNKRHGSIIDFSNYKISRIIYLDITMICDKPRCFGP